MRISKSVYLKILKSFFSEGIQIYLLYLFEFICGNSFQEETFVEQFECGDTVINLNFNQFCTFEFIS